ncbi:MAG: HAMP domain-containing sensor histidine kinase [Halanaerobium sp.]|nr:HAMP domain-containing sensor histidine kinase [Halanaerobium sp.]
MIKLSSLSSKIIALFLLVSIGTILVTGWVINHYLNNNFAAYLLQAEKARHDQIAGELQQQLKDAEEPLPLLLTRSRAGALQQIKFQVYDEDNNLIYDSSQHFMQEMNSMMDSGMMHGWGPRGRNPSAGMQQEIRSEYAIELEGGTGRLVLTSYAPALYNNQAIKFKDTLDRAFLVAGIIVIILSIVLTAIIAPRLIRPLQKIRIGALQMKKGDWSHRVNYHGKDELGAVAESLNLLAAEVERLEEVRKKVTANVAHELRNPLMSLQSYLEGMQDGIIRPDKDNLEVLHQEVMRINRFVTDLQELTSVDSEIYQLEKVTVNFTALVKTRVDHYHNLFIQKGISLEQYYRDKEIMITGNHRALEHILDNLLGNALKYTPSGEKVEVRLAAAGDLAVLNIKDSGPGISSADLPYVFERFYRADRESSGSGIGLTIVKEYVQALGGSIEVASEPGQGTSFTITFPLV